MTVEQPIVRACLPDLTDDTLVGSWLNYMVPTGRDYSTYGNHGTPTAVILGQNGIGKFNGTSSFISTVQDSSLDFATGDFTLSAWVYGTESTIIAKGVGTLAANVDYAWNATQFFFRGAWRDVNVGLVASKWQLVCGVFTDADDTFKVYRDGQYVTQATDITGAYPSSGVGVYIGRQGSGAANYWNGSLFDARIYAEAKGSVWISELYKSGVPR